MPRRSEKKHFSKNDFFFAFFSEFSRFFQNSKNQKPQTHCKLTFWSVGIIARIILARTIAFLVFFGDSKYLLFFRPTKQQTGDFTSKYDLCNDCDTPKSWLATSLRFLIFLILKKSWKFAEKRKNESFLLKCFFRYVESKPP